ncbi:MAG: hypothetical protein QNK04_20605 [Myxococcota bacterium]|nr:hypothetical protein [Myxococcota bacterium]
MGARTASLSLLVILLVLGCASDLTVRAPEVGGDRADSSLAGVAPVAVELPPAAGAHAESKVVGERAAGLGLSAGQIALTEDPGHVVRRLVASELEAAGHRVVEADPQVVVGVSVEEFRVEAPRHGRGWEVLARVRVLLRIHGPRDAGEHTDLVYTAESKSVTYVRPSLAMTERVLGECLTDLARLVRERESLSRALTAYGAQAANRARAGSPPSAA